MNIKTLVLVCSCQATADRRDACRETWLAHDVPDGVRVVFIVGRPGVASALAGDTLYLDCDDSYIGLPQKMHRAYQEALARFQFDWLFKTDDDSWINLYRIDHYPRTRDYIGKPVALKGEDPTWHRTVVPKKELVGAVSNYDVLDKMHADAGGWHGPWASGMGYFLSRHAAGLMAKEPWAHAMRELYEDKYTGDVMGSYGIYLHGQHETFRDLKANMSNIHGATVLHPCPPKIMREVYWRLHRAGEIQT